MFFKGNIFGICIVLAVACLSSMHCNMCLHVCQVAPNEPVSVEMNFGPSAEESSSSKEKNNNGNVLIRYQKYYRYGTPNLKYGNAIKDNTVGCIITG